jgi:hypothetical protein
MDYVPNIKPVTKQFGPLLPDFRLPPWCKWNLSLCWDVTRRRLVGTDVSGQPIGSILKVQTWSLSLEDGTDRLSWNIRNYQSTLRDIPEERRFSGAFLFIQRVLCAWLHVTRYTMPFVARIVWRSSKDRIFHCCCCLADIPNTDTNKCSVQYPDPPNVRVAQCGELSVLRHQNYGTRRMV